MMKYYKLRRWLEADKGNNNSGGSSDNSDSTPNAPIGISENEVQIRVSSAVDEAVANILSTVGVANVEDLQTAVSGYTEYQQQNQTELDKLTQERDALQNDLNARS